MDPPAAGLGAAFAAAPPRLDVRERAGGGPRRAAHRVRARQGGWRIIVDQCDGLCSRQPRRLRPLGGRRPDGMVLRACAAVFSAAGALGGRRRRLSRGRRSAGDGNVALRGSALRCLWGCRPRCRPAGDRGLQRRAAGRLRTYADDDRAWPALQRRGRLSLPGAVAPQPDRGDQGAGDPAAVRRCAGRRRRVHPPWREDRGAGGA